MIGRLRGIIAHIGEDNVIIDCGGVGYLVYVTSHLLQNIIIDEAKELWIETRVRENDITLYGFEDETEKSWFNMVTSVQGVGAKGGLAILSVLNQEELFFAISGGDKAAITRANGIGPKIAARIISELKDKVGSTAIGGSSNISLSPKRGMQEGSTGNMQMGILQELKSALINLGYTSMDATKAASLAMQNAPEDASLETLIPLALKELSS
ncbi:MAG: Holliday junction branch migration protein RuvA [Alphaproteobacteria bacterium]